jgi:Flp pilus assembly protein TadG
MRSLMGHKEHCSRRAQRCARDHACWDGSVAAELALVAPLIMLIAVGIVDFGMLATKSAALVGTTRIGAEYATLYPTDTAGIQNSMQTAMSFVPALGFPASFPFTCECDDRGSIACGESCATMGRPAPNRLFMTISASQSFTPLVPWPGIPATLTAAMQVRLQ